MSLPSFSARDNTEAPQRCSTLPLFQATANGPACCWWLLAVLPIDPRYQLSVLSMTTLKERLVKIQHILTYLQSIPNN